jgi:DNA-binding MarR family transcriptional regulator/DNA-binding CsgD family transcriptional regulator
MLRTAGLNPAEETVYLSLVRQGGATPRELTERTGLETARVSRAVVGLDRKGLVHRTPPPHERIVPVPPDLAVEQLIRRRIEDLERTREAAHRLAHETQHQLANRRTEELIEIVSGRAAVGRAFERVQRTARREMRVLDAPPYATQAGVNQMQLDRQAEGIVYRGVYDAAALAEPGYLATVATHVHAGEQARLTDAVPTKLAIADGELALLPLAWATLPVDAFHSAEAAQNRLPADVLLSAEAAQNRPTAHDAALLVHRCGLLDALIALFETVWALATPLALTDENGISADGAVSADDRNLLSLLVAGLTDEAAGARLGVSRRTVVRRVQRLMELTSSRSRLQLGWRARERGWL